MTDARSETVSVVERTQSVAADGAVIAAHFLGRTAVFVLGEEAMVFAEPEGEPRRVAVHDGAILTTAADGKRVLSGGDDGKLAATTAKGETRALANDPKHRWIDHVALGRGGAVAWSAGKTAFAQAKEGKEQRELEVPSTSCPRASASPSRIITARRCGFPTRPKRQPRSSNGKARISAPP